MSKRRAVLSVWDKTSIESMARVLLDAGYQILSTSSTASTLRGRGITVQDIADYTGFPETLGGRVKTIHPKIAGGILSRRQDSSVEPIDVVVCNLYPFERGVQERLSHAQMIELIDIGGVTLLRAAAKNHEFVTAVPAVEYYDRVSDEIRATGDTTPELRRELAQATFELTSRYDSAIATYLQRTRRE
uniref:MGS-like domain-containing protein n=1 Tax=candidate division WOR-3 bacterium TaxID=2052148 RepID=A0A7C4CC35_UNCW3